MHGFCLLLDVTVNPAECSSHTSEFPAFILIILLSLYSFYFLLLISLGVTLSYTLACETTLKWIEESRLWCAQTSLNTLHFKIKMSASSFYESSGGTSIRRFDYCYRPPQRGPIHTYINHLSLSFPTCSTSGASLLFWDFKWRLLKFKTQNLMYYSCFCIYSCFSFGDWIAKNLEDMEKQRNR